MKRSERADGWYQQALHDMDMARAMAREGFYDGCAFACQQAVELVIKALWMDVRGGDPPRTHWAERLAADLQAPDEIIEHTNMVVPDYTASRYPDAAGAMPYLLYHLEEAEDRLRRAQAILNWASAMWENDDSQEHLG